MSDRFENDSLNKKAATGVVERLIMLGPHYENRYDWIHRQYGPIARMCSVRIRRASLL